MCDIVVLSDLHGSLIKIEEPFDLMLIAGDVCPVYNHNRQFQKEWLEDEFVGWVSELPFKNETSRVVMIAGNHDFYLEGLTEAKKEKWTSLFNDRLDYLDNEEYTFYHEDTKPIRIFGTPYCKIFGNWAFMRDNLDKYYKVIPENLDILISHDAADINGLGMINEGRNIGVNAGNRVLTKYLLERKPKYYFCGHIHSGKHDLEDIGQGIMGANVSIMNEYYYPVYNPLRIKI